MRDVQKNARKMTARQSAFVAAYIVSLNATQAAKDAGYSPKTASQIGERLLRNVEVAKAIEAAKKERAERTKITQDDVLKELGRIAFFDIGKAFTPDGALKPLDEMDEDTRRALAGLEVVSLTSEGEHVGTLKKVKIADKLGALSKLAQHLGMLDPKITLKGDAQSPLQLLIQQIQGNSLKPVRQSVWGGDQREDDNT
jgi:phage terminase small subunit